MKIYNNNKNPGINIERHEYINKLIKKGKEIPNEISKNFVSFELSDKPFKRFLILYCRKPSYNDV